MAGQFAAFNKHVSTSQAQLTALEGKLRSIKLMGFLGGAATGIGVAGLYAFKGPLEEAKAWTQEAARFSSLGFGSKIDQDAQKFAMGMRTYGTSARENLTLLSDAMAVFKDLAHAEMAAPVMAQMKFANEAVFGAETGGDNTRKFMDLMKVIEFRRGLSSLDAFKEQANFAQKTITGSRGRVDQAALLQALKTGGVGISRLSNEAFYLGLEPIIQEFGGFRTGTGINAIYNNLVQSRGSIASQNELLRLGLLDKNQVQLNSLGGIKKITGDQAFLGANVFETEGPLALLQKVLLPAFAKHGIVTEDQVLHELGRIMSNSRGAGLLARVYQQMPTIERMVAANRNAMGIDELTAAGKNTPQGKMQQLQAQYANVKLQFGLIALPIAVKALTWLTDVLLAIKKFTTEFPGLTKAIVIGFGVLAALVAAGGAVTLATAGFKALGLAFVIGKGAGIGSALLNLAGGLGTVAKVLGTVGAAIAVFTAAYAGTRWLADLVTPKDWTFGGWLYDKTHPAYDPNAPAGRGLVRGTRGAIAPADHGASGATSYVRTAGPALVQTQVNTQVNLDGRKFADVVSQHFSWDMQRPQTGISGFDPLMHLVPAGGVGDAGF